MKMSVDLHADGKMSNSGRHNNYNPDDPSGNGH